MILDMTDGMCECTRAHDRSSLAGIARMLEPTAATLPPNYLPGKTALRDIVMARLGCSALRAEHIVDSLESRGLVRFDAGRPGRARNGMPEWTIQRPCPR